MVLEAVVYPQDPFGYGGREVYDFNYNNLLPYEEEKPQDLDQENGYAYASLDFLENQTLLHHNWDSMLLPDPSSASASADANNSMIPTSNNSVPARPKRRRLKTSKNKQEIETQRMTHIAVERNRRKQMNDYLSVLRSLMPDSYVQRGDQASIIGGAINFVKELEQRLQFLGVDKHRDLEGKWRLNSENGGNLAFSEFFTFPQYWSTESDHHHYCKSRDHVVEAEAEEKDSVGECAGNNYNNGIADIEVTMVETHANLKIRSKKRPKQLLKIVSTLHSMRLTILHLNLTTTSQIVLYSLSVKVEDDCKLGSVDDIAAALFQMMSRIHQEAMLLLNQNPNSS